MIWAVMKRIWPSPDMWCGGFLGAFSVSTYHADVIGMFTFGIFSLYLLVLAVVRAFEEADKHAR